jgi:hypothetical protein
MHPAYAKALSLTSNALTSFKSCRMKKIAFLLSCLLTHFYSNAQYSTLNRIEDPFVLTGAQLPSLYGIAPSLLVGFKYENGTWLQIPIQVDERVELDIVAPYGPFTIGTIYAPSPAHPTELFYTDPTTYIGSDTDPNFDANDELVFMVRDCGGVRMSTVPNGVLANTCVEVQLYDALDDGLGYLYLFQQNGTLSATPSSYMNFSTDLNTTPGYPAHLNGTNIENTTITGTNYVWHFSSEWVSDELRITTGGNINILDRHKLFYANGNCIRSEDIFSSAENAFIAVKAGPIRVIRSYMGAVSGPLTQRTHLFYPERHDLLTDMRVHHVASIYDAFDYSPSASGMLYTNNLNSLPATINGFPDNVLLGDLTWEQVRGFQGMVSILHRRTTNYSIPGEAVFTSYYDDNSSTPASNCTGDGFAFGTSGLGVLFPNATLQTDPILSTGNLRELQSQRIMYYSAGAAANPTRTMALNTTYNTPLAVYANPCNTATFPIAVRCLLEGYMNGPGSMENVLYNQGTDATPSNRCDSLRLDLIDSSNQFQIRYSIPALIQTDGWILAQLPAAFNGALNNDIGIRHRNTLAIRTENPVVTVPGGTIDLTLSPALVRGNDLAPVVGGRFAMFSGDMETDFVIDLFDYLLLEADITNGSFGNVSTDLNGDGIVDAFDYIIFDPNQIQGKFSWYY